VLHLRKQRQSRKGLSRFGNEFFWRPVSISDYLVYYFSAPEACSRFTISAAHTPLTNKATQRRMKETHHFIFIGITSFVPPFSDESIGVHYIIQSIILMLKFLYICRPPS
jgi:hypothetical protein